MVTKIFGFNKFWRKLKKLFIRILWYLLYPWYFITEKFSEIAVIVIFLTIIILAILFIFGIIYFDYNSIVHGFPNTPCDTIFTIISWVITVGVSFVFVTTIANTVLKDVNEYIKKFIENNG